MKKKVNLTNLLAKYEGNSPIYRETNTSPRSFAGGESNYDQNGWGNTYQYQEIQVNSPPISGNFQMSKSQCQQFLLRVKEQIRKQERSLDNLAQTSMKQVHMKFQANHEKIKRQILNLLEKAFHDNERYITQELKKQGNSQPQQFIPVHRKITQIDEEINRLLYGLKSTDYRRSIAQVVMKDYSMELSSLKQTVKNARQSFLSSLGQVEPDRSRIDCMREDLQKLFKLSKKNSAMVQQSLFSVLGEKFKANLQNDQHIEKSVKLDNMKSSTGNAFLLSPKSHYQQENYNEQKQQQRKSMFNFGLFQ